MSMPYDETAPPAEYCWQAAGGRLSAALGEVFLWLSARELAAAGAACRAWRHAADEPRLWRRLLRRLGVTENTLRALREHYPSLSWRQEYINVCSGWELVARLPPETEAEQQANEHSAETPRRRGGGGGTPLTHAALDEQGTRLALAADDGTFLIWERTSGTWREEWSADLRARGWQGAVRAQWGAGGGDARLLMTGALALADRWELLVLQRDEFGIYRCEARAGCSAGAAGCWAGADAFLSLELSRLAPRLAVTVVWLNAATQETQSEYAGVTTPLLRVFNEDSAHITHALVADVPLEAFQITNDVGDEELNSLGFSYYNATNVNSKRISEESVQTLVTASHGASGALRAWAMRARRPPPLHAADAGSLEARARRRRQSAADPPPEPDEPDEATVRAMCDPPDAQQYLHAAVLGLVLHSSGKCLWASTADGQAWCVSLPALTRLARLRGAPGAFPADHYYVQPAASASFVAAPAGGRDARIRVWSALSGAPCPRPPLPAQPAAPALVCLLPLHQDELFVLAGHSLFCPHSAPHPAGRGRGRLEPAQSTATHTAHRTPPPPSALSMALRTTLKTVAKFTQRQPGLALTGGRRGVRAVPTGSPPCAGPPPPRICPCKPPRRPPCRAAVSERTQARVVTCCPVPRGNRPPCAPCPKKPSLTCSRRKLSYCAKRHSTETNGGYCGLQNDRVAQRLAEAERARRDSYEREVRERRAARPVPTAPARYCLGFERECARATDGRQYAVVRGEDAPAPRCGPGRSPPPPECLEVLSDGPCQIHNVHVDPCAHRPRTILQIDRSQAKPVDKNHPKTSSKQNNDTKAGDKACEMKRNPPPAPPCHHPSVLEGLRQRGPGPCAGEQKAPPHSRAIHTLTTATVARRGLEKDLNVQLNQFSTNLHFRTNFPPAKINRATSPLAKMNFSCNSSDKDKNKRNSWQSFCKSLGGGKKTKESKKNQELKSKGQSPPYKSASPCKPTPLCKPEQPMSGSQPAPFCKPVKPVTLNLPPNPCKPKKNENVEKKTTETQNKASPIPASACANKQSPATAKPLKQEMPPSAPCNWKPGPPLKSSKDTKCTEPKK